MCRVLFLDRCNLRFGREFLQMELRGSKHQQFCTMTYEIWDLRLDIEEKGKTLKILKVYFIWVCSPPLNCEGFSSRDPICLQFFLLFK